MRLFTAVFLVVYLNSCGQGANEIAHNGLCDGYQDWEQSEYVLPFESGNAHEVGQGNCSPISHFGSQRYAYDFTMDVGTTLVASRAGTVIEVEESFDNDNGCPDDNHVYIRHADNTVAAYVHLTKDGADVSVGEEVTQGQAIGRSGNTGCSTDPHLHFVVFTDEGKKDSVPVTFRNTEANSRGLQTGDSYPAL